MATATVPFDSAQGTVIRSLSGVEGGAAEVVDMGTTTNRTCKVNAIVPTLKPWERSFGTLQRPAHTHQNRSTSSNQPPQPNFQRFANVPAQAVRTLERPGHVVPTLERGNDENRSLSGVEGGAAEVVDMGATTNRTCKVNTLNQVT